MLCNNPKSCPKNHVILIKLDIQAVKLFTNEVSPEKLPNFYVDLAHVLEYFHKKEFTKCKRYVKIKAR